VLSLSAVEPSLDLVWEAGIERIRRKSMALSAYCISLIDAALVPLGCTLGTVRDAERRGSHVSVRHPEGARIVRCLIDEMGVLPDFREPDNLRFGLAPLYTTYLEVWTAVELMRRAIAEGRYLHHSPRRVEEPHHDGARRRADGSTSR
jgi:kynureninase